MDKESSFTEADYSMDHRHNQHQQDQVMKQHIGDDAFGHNNSETIDHCTLNVPQHSQHISSGFSGNIPTSLDKFSFADVMQFDDLGPKLALNQTKMSEEETGMDPVYFLNKFPFLNDKVEEQSPMVPADQLGADNEHERFKGVAVAEEERATGENDEAKFLDNTLVQHQFLRDHQDLQVENTAAAEAKNKRKRSRTMKTSEEVESQRMTHIAVERNRRKQMNEHLRVLRSLMPGSYVQRGDQASIIGGAIEFVRELEQLLQCLESQKQRRLMGDSSSLPIQQPDQPPFFPVDFETGLLPEERAENKSFLADVEVKLLGFDAMIKILCRRRPGQLTKTIAALEDLQLNILHTNITTIEQTVLYSFNVKVAGESSFTAEDIATSVQQIFAYIHANSSM